MENIIIKKLKLIKSGTSYFIRIAPSIMNHSDLEEGKEYDVTFSLSKKKEIADPDDI